MEKELERMLRENEERKRIAAMPEESTDVDAGSIPADADGAMSFAEWCERCVKIKPKGGGPDIPFVLNRPQRKLVRALEKMRRAGRPIRLVLLKARQWGGSTCVQLYMAWLQLTVSTGLNSLIIAHQVCAGDEIKDMFDRMLRSYGAGDSDDEDAPARLTLKRVGRSGGIFRVEERDCKIKVGTAERPDSSRGGDYNLVHLSEVGLWKRTKGKSPEDIVRSACSGVLLRPLTMIVMESTANGAGTYFHREYLAASKGESQFEALFVSWFEIEQYSEPLADAAAFARMLIENRDDDVGGERFESGRYLWSLWERGATLEAVNWYIGERRKYSSHAAMAAEYPSDDVEAFAHGGERVFSPEAVERMRRHVEEVRRRGEVNEEGRFVEDSCGHLAVWRQPEAGGWRDRYLVVVDVGGRSAKSDWSVVSVIDRCGAGGLPEVAAQWRGHTDHDLLAAIAERIARWYGEALLVIESNTLESRDPERDVDGDQAPWLLRELMDRYPNLYMRQTPGGRPRPGFHTNMATKQMIIGALVKAVREGLYVERDADCLDELVQYERRPNGSFGACVGCHDDILMTRAIGIYISEYEMAPPSRRGPRAVRRGGRPLTEAAF